MDLHGLRTLALGIGVLLAATLTAPPSTAITHTETFATHAFDDVARTTAEWDTLSQTLHLAGISMPPGATVTTSGAIRVIPDGAALYIAHLGRIEIVEPWSPFSSIGNITWVPTSLPQIKDIALDGNRLVVAVQTQTGILPPVFHYNVVLYDVTDPSSPTWVSSHSLSAPPTSVCTLGGYAYATVSGDLRAIDLFGGAPVTSVVTPGTAGGVAAQGNYLYVGDDTALRVYDISVPISPSARGSSSLMNWTQLGPVAVDGDLALVAAGSEGYMGFWVADPDAPTIRFALPSPGPGPVNRMTINGDIVTLSMGSGGVRLWEFPVNGAPSREVFTALGSDVRDAVAVGTSMFVADASAGVTRYTAATSIEPFTVSYDPFVGFTSEALSDVEVEGDYLYTNDGCLNIYQIRDPWNPVLKSTLGCLPGGGGSVETIAVDGDLLYMVSPTTFSVVSIEDRSFPFVRGSLASTGTPLDIEIDGDRAYVCDGAGGVRVFVISSPLSPWLATTVTGLGTVSAIEASGDYLFAKVDGVGMRILDGVPSSPTYLSVLGTYVDANVSAMKVHGHHVFLADTGVNEFVRVVDVTNPAAPAIHMTRQINPALNPRSLACDGDRLWVGGDNAIAVYTLEDLTLFELDRYETSPIITYTHDNLSVAGDLLFASMNSTLLTRDLVIRRAFVRDVDAANRVAQSLPLYNGSVPVGAVRVTPSAAFGEQVDWYVSSSHSGTPLPVAGDGVWHTVAPDALGAIVRWRAELNAPYGREHPVVSSVTVDWRHLAGRILAIDDVPADQGGFVTVSLEAGAFDGTGLSPAATSYTLFRQAGAWAGVSTTWDSVTAVPATGQDTYNILAPTPTDSSLFFGPRPWRYFVRGWTDSAGYYVDTPVDSGYSVDNIAPGQLTQLTAEYNTTKGGNVLGWLPVSEADFYLYRIYRNTDQGFPPGSASLVDTITNINVSSWVDPTWNGWNQYYAMTVVDSAGNESPAAYPGVTTDVGKPPAPDHWSLRQNVPNPFNPVTTISFAVPQGGGHVTLTVFDVAGRRIATLLDGRVGVGMRSLTWDGRDRSGRQVASGVYFYRLTTPVGVFTRKMVLVE